jgi:transposase
MPSIPRSCDQHAAGVKGGIKIRKRSAARRGGFSTKIHLRTNVKGDPLTFDVMPGEAHEVKGYDALMGLHDVDPDRLLADKGYDSDEIRENLADRGIEPVIPPRSNRKTTIDYYREAYKRRNLIERCVNHLKQFRRIATRYEKTARAYLSMLCIASTMLRMKTVNTLASWTSGSDHLDLHRRVSRQAEHPYG